MVTAFFKECDDYIRERQVISNLQKNDRLNQQVKHILNHIMMLYREPFHPIKFGNLKLSKSFLFKHNLDSIGTLTNIGYFRNVTN